MGSGVFTHLERFRREGAPHIEGHARVGRRVLSLARSATYMDNKMSK